MFASGRSCYGVHMAALLLFVVWWVRLLVCLRYASGIAGFADGLPTVDGWVHLAGLMC